MHQPTFATIMARLQPWAFGALLLTAASTAGAGVTYRFSFDQSQYTVERGTSLAIPLYFEEVTTPPSTSLLLSEHGLSSIGVTLSRTASSGAVPPFLSGVPAVTPNPTDFFDSSDLLFFPSIEVSPQGDQARLLEFARSSGVTGAQPVAGLRRILIGTFIFSTGSRSGPTATYQASAYSTTSANTLTWDNLLALDAPSAPPTPATITITTVRGPCGTADFNGDDDVGTDADIEAFFACLAGSCCPDCDTADFNGDGDTGTDADIEAFFRVLAGGRC